MSLLNTLNNPNLENTNLKIENSKHQKEYLYNLIKNKTELHKILNTLYNKYNMNNYTEEMVNNINSDSTICKYEILDNDILVTIKHKNEIITFVLTYDPLDKFDILDFKTTFTKNTIAKEQIYFAITELLLG